MEQWPYVVRKTPADLIQLYCVQNSTWQKFRLSLKGLPTREKLAKLEQWGLEHNWAHPTRIQVDNYINALRRGGQLDLNNRVKS